MPRIPAQRKQNVEARLTPGMVNNPSPHCGEIRNLKVLSGSIERPETAEEIDPSRLMDCGA